MPTLTIIAGKIRHYSGGGGSASLVLSPKPGTSEPCCCKECDPDCAISQSGLQDTIMYGWDVDTTDDLPKTLPIEVEFKYETSANCGGSNGGRQSGSLNCCFTLDEDASVEISVDGVMEQQDAGFDFGTLSLGGVQAQISSFNRDLGCEMTTANDTKTVSLTAGVHHYTMSADTVDGAFHAGMIHTYKIKKA